MTFDEIAHIGKILAGIGVLGSLIFVGIQIYQNTKSIRASTLQLNTDYWTTFLTSLADSQLSEVFGMGMTGNASLTPRQFGQFTLLLRGFLLGLENQHYQYGIGLLDHEKYSSYELSLRQQVFGFPGFRASWKIVRHTYSPEFVGFVDQQIAITPLHTEFTFNEWKALCAEIKKSKGEK